MIERMIWYFKDRNKSFDDYYHCNSNKQNCDLQHVYNWIKLFVYIYCKNQKYDSIQNGM